MTPPSARVRRAIEIIFWLGLAGVVGFKAWPQLAAAVGAGSPGDEAPALVVTTLPTERPSVPGGEHTLQGEALSLRSLRGQVVLVNFWATWCPPCRVEMPAFERLYRDRADEGFVILGLSVDRAGRGVVRDFLSERDITFPNAMASEEMKRAFGGIRGLPTSILIDREGRIRHRVTGIFTEPALRLAVGRLLAEKPAED
jgi:thiol-disulfide isomerase/thioredoxin